MVRDASGQYVAVFARHFSFVSLALRMKMEACKGGLLISIHEGWNEVDSKTDCTMLLNMLNNSVFDLSDVGCIVEDCKDYMSNVRSI